MVMDYSLATFICILWVFSAESKIISNIGKNSEEFRSLAPEVQHEYLKNNEHEENGVKKLSSDKNMEIIDYNKIDEDSGDFIGQNEPLDFLLSQFIIKQLRKQLQVERKEKNKELANHISSFSSPFQGCSADPCPSSESGKIKKFKINLDIHPEERWKEVMENKEKEIKNLATFFETKFGKKFMNIVDNYISWLHNTLPKEYFLELQGIAKTTNITIGRVTLYNIFYEFFSVCTSVIMEGGDGKMYHGRNLDFGLFMGWDAKNHSWFLTELLRPLIIKVDFYKNEKLLYSAVTYAGFTGILTGVKKNQFSLTIDERFNRNGGYIGVMEWILGRRDESWLGLLTRQVMESAETYKQAQKILVSTNLVAPVYFILAGNSTQQGCIITRGRSNADIWELGNLYDGQTGHWYLVETNYDHWRQTPFFDQRRHYAIQCMEKYGRKKPLDTLYGVLSTRPVFNKETTLTALMDVSEGLLLVWERECEDPCWPF